MWGIDPEAPPSERPSYEVLGDIGHRLIASPHRRQAISSISHFLTALLVLLELTIAVYHASLESLYINITPLRLLHKSFFSSCSRVRACSVCSSSANMQRSSEARAPLANSTTWVARKHARSPYCKASQYLNTPSMLKVKVTGLQDVSKKNTEILQAKQSHWNVCVAFGFAS